MTEQYSEEEVFAANKKCMLELYDHILDTEPETRNKIMFAACYMRRYENMKHLREKGEREVFRKMRKKIEKAETYDDMYQIANDIGIIDKEKYSALDASQFMGNIQQRI